MRLAKLSDILLVAAALCTAIRLKGWQGNLPDPLTLVLGITSAAFVAFRMRKMLEKRQEEFLQRRKELLEIAARRTKRD